MSPFHPSRGLAFLAVFLISMVAFSSVEGVGAQQGASVVKVAVDLVPLNVTVTDGKGHIVPGLREAEFEVYEDDVKQTISFFGTEAVPVSWGLVLDRSGSMENMIGEAHQAMLNMMDQASPADDIFVMLFDDRVFLASDFSLDRLQLRNSISSLFTIGHTALYDAVGRALEHVQSGRHAKRVLVVITDGEDNDSNIQLDRLVERVQENRDVMVYTVGMLEYARVPWWEDKPRYMAEKVSSLTREIRKLAEVSGASAYFPKNAKESRNAMQGILREVGQHYSIGYYPSDRRRDGHWRNLKVEVVRNGKRDTRLTARTRTGYYAPSVGSF